MGKFVSSALLRCYSGEGERIVEEETNYSAPVQAHPRDEAEAEADEAKRKAAEQGAKATPKGEAVQDLDPIAELSPQGGD